MMLRRSYLEVGYRVDVEVKVMTSWWLRVATGLVFIAVSAVLQLFMATVSVVAGEQPSEAQILEALQAKHLTRCPQLKSGCGGAQFEKPEATIEVAFDYGSAKLRRSARLKLVTLGGALSNPELKDRIFLIAGHADAKGGDAYNQALSERRAEAVRSFLMKKFNLPAEKLKAVGFGKTQLKTPASPFADENRRVQIQVVNMSVE